MSQAKGLQGNNSQKSNKNDSSYSSAFLQLQEILLKYLSENPKVSLNRIAQVCSVSEPSLRRIRNGQIKTMPSITTILELLSYISKKKTSQQILEAFPGALSEYLKTKAPQLDAHFNVEASETLSVSLNDPIKYLVFKLALGKNGVTRSKVTELFGSLGLKQLHALEHDELITFTGKAYKAEDRYVVLSNDTFVERFKLLADFIKPHKHATAAKSFSPTFSNYSSSLNKNAYKQVVKVQRAANRKIAKILTNDKSSGDIPTFFLNAIDTIDNICADEFPDDDSVS